MRRLLSLISAITLAACSAHPSMPGADPARTQLGGVRPKVVQPGQNGRWLVFPEPGGRTDLYPFQIVRGPDRNVWFTVQEYSGGGEIGFVDNAGNITQFQIPVTAYPWDITSAPDGKLWFADTRNSVIGSCTTSGVITTYTAPANGGITSGPSKSVWFGSGNNIGKVTSSGKMTFYPVGVHVYELTPGPDGKIWFTVGTITRDSRTVIGNQAVMIGKMSIDGSVKFYTIPNASGEGVGITAGQDGNLWVLVENGGNPGMIVRVTTDGDTKEYTLPGDVQGVDNNRIISAPSGELWYTRNSANSTQYIGKISLAGKLREYLYPTTDQHVSFLGGLAIGNDGNVWFSQTNPVQDGMNVYMRLFMHVRPASVTFSGVGQSQNVTASETNYASGWKADSSDENVATVKPGSYSNVFVITSVGAGSATISVSDERGNSFDVPVTVQ